MSTAVGFQRRDREREGEAKRAGERERERETRGEKRKRENGAAIKDKKRPHCLLSWLAPPLCQPILFIPFYTAPLREFHVICVVPEFS